VVLRRAVTLRVREAKEVDFFKKPHKPKPPNPHPPPNTESDSGRTFGKRRGKTVAVRSVKNSRKGTDLLKRCSPEKTVQIKTRQEGAGQRSLKKGKVLSLKRKKGTWSPISDSWGKLVGRQAETNQEC